MSQDQTAPMFYDIISIKCYISKKIFVKYHLALKFARFLSVNRKQKVRSSVNSRQELIERINNTFNELKHEQRMKLEQR